MRRALLEFLPDPARWSADVCVGLRRAEPRLLRCLEQPQPWQILWSISSIDYSVYSRASRVAMVGPRRRFHFVGREHGKKSRPRGPAWKVFGRGCL